MMMTARRDFVQRTVIDSLVLDVVRGDQETRHDDRAVSRVQASVDPREHGLHEYGLRSCLTQIAGQ